MWDVTGEAETKGYESVPATVSGAEKTGVSFLEEEVLFNCTLKSGLTSSKQSFHRGRRGRARFRQSDSRHTGCALENTRACAQKRHSAL